MTQTAINLDASAVERMAKAIRPAAFKRGANPVWVAMAYRDAAKALAALCVK